jgi:N-acetylmuramoyl-L-alanine amidase
VNQVHRALIALSLIGLAGSTLAAEVGPPPRPLGRVVIDPGHGGTDFGAIFDFQGRRYAEKEAALALALETSNALKKRQIDVVLTRTQDRDVSLTERTALANKIKADVFLSIHLNAGTGPLMGPGGTETYILNQTSNDTSQRLAYLENSSNRPNLPQNQNTDISLIVKDLTLEANLPESKRLACAIQNRLISLPKTANFTPPHNRGVKQALFHVLLGADMPSALLEVGFLSHPADRERLFSPEGRSRLAQALADAVVSYFETKNTAKATLQLSRCQVR